METSIFAGFKNKAAASNGSAAVCVGMLLDGSVVCVKYAPKSIADWENRDEFLRLAEAAKSKLLAKKQ
jgi:hypothetical protein